MIGYKLVRKRKDGSYGPLFCNRSMRIPVDQWVDAEPHPTKGLKFNPFWHVCKTPNAPHLSIKGRVWVRCQVEGIQTRKRPASQGGTWWLANRIKILEEIHV